MKKRLLLLSCLLVLILGTSCICSAKVKILKIGNKKFNTSMQVGDKLKIKLKKSNGKKIQWKSSNKSVASINSKGCIKAKKTGRATITVINGKVKIKGKVKVVKNKEAAAINNVEITATPVLIPTEQPVSRVTEAPVVVTPTAEPTVSPSPTPTKKPILCADTWLFIEIDQKAILRDTRIISGKVYCNKGMETIVKVVANSTVIAEIILNKDEDTFSLETDFSECKVGDRVGISVSKVGESFIEGENEDYIFHHMTWPGRLSYEILE